MAKRKIKDKAAVGGKAGKMRGKGSLAIKTPVTVFVCRRSTSKPPKRKFVAASLLPKRKHISEEQAEKTVVSAVKKVNVRAYSFDPEMLLAVGVDVEKGRVLVKPVKLLTDDLDLSFVEEMIQKVSTVVKWYCVEERIRRGLNRECDHPRWARKRKRVQVGEGHFQYKRFCTKCGVQFFDPPKEKENATVAKEAEHQVG